MSRTGLNILQLAAIGAIVSCVEGVAKSLIVAVACVVLGVANYVEGRRFD